MFVLSSPLVEFIASHILIIASFYFVSASIIIFNSAIFDSFFFSFFFYPFILVANLLCMCVCVCVEIEEPRKAEVDSNKYNTWMRTYVHATLLFIIYLMTSDYM